MKILTHLALTATAVVLTSTLAFGHGDTHSKKTAAGTTSAEQKDFGIVGDPKKAARTIEVLMDDNMRFTPSQIEVKRGETVRLIVRNKGRLMHEMVLGTMKDLKEHAEMMKQFPGMEHDEPHMAHVAPGKTETLVWTFNRPGEFHFGCLVAGHFDAGMLGKITVK
jgi:uncharacterized cupredoxin-like copper-binding protein